MGILFTDLATINTSPPRYNPSQVPAPGNPLIICQPVKIFKKWGLRHKNISVAQRWDDHGDFLSPLQTFFWQTQQHQHFRTLHLSYLSFLRDILHRLVPPRCSERLPWCKWRCDVGGGTPGISLCHAVMTGPPSVTQFVTPEPCHHVTGDQDNKIKANW